VQESTQRVNPGIYTDIEGMIGMALV